ncbi:MAG: IS3 family transposase [Pseudonocardiaceae bacterium]|nr:IS3 family transposase [Pseudonocardiaceae bacterium]
MAAGQRDFEGRVGFLREGARPSTATLVTFITERQDQFGVEPISTVLTEFGVQIAPSTYYAALSRPKSARDVRDEELMTEIQRVYEENYSVYGARKIWRQLNREAIQVGRGRVERLMQRLRLVGAVRGKMVRTTVSDTDGVRAADLVKRQFTAGAPNRLWVADFTHVTTWAGTVYVAFSLDAFSRTIVGWTTSMSKETGLVLDTIEMGLHAWRLSLEWKWRQTHSPFRCRKSDRIQPVEATPGCWSNSRCSLRASAGVLQPSVLRGLVLRA